MKIIILLVSIVVIPSFAYSESYTKSYAICNCAYYGEQSEISSCISDLTSDSWWTKTKNFFTKPDIPDEFLNLGASECNRAYLRRLADAHRQQQQMEAIDAAAKAATQGYQLYKSYQYYQQQTQ